MTYNFDKHLEAALAKHYAELDASEPNERIAWDCFAVIHTYDNGIECEEFLNREELEEDYELIELLKSGKDYSYEGIVRYEVFSVCEEYIGEEVINSYAEKLLYSEEF